MNKTYQVVITGINDSYSKAQVTENLAKLFKTPIDKIPNILNQSRYIIKKNLDLITAQKYQSSIEQQGCLCVIEADADLDLNIVESAEPLSNSSSELVTNIADISAMGPTTEKTPKPDSGYKFCHACGYKLSRIAKFCRSCGSAQSSVRQSFNSSSENTKDDKSNILSPKLLNQIAAPTDALNIKVPTQTTLISKVEELSTRDNLKRSSGTKMATAGVLAIVLAGTFFGIWSNSKTRAIPVSSSPTVSLAQPNLTAAPSTAADYHEDSSDTVAGKFTIRTFNSSNTERAIFLNGKEIEKCLNENQHSICDGEFLSVDKIFNIADKTILMTSYVNGSWCPATFQFFTISKDGSYQKSEDFGNCAELPSDAAVISDTKIIVTLPTLEQNMMGNEVWTYQNGKVTGPVKTIKPKFNVDVNEAQKIVASNGTHNQITGEVIKEGVSYYLKFDSPAMIVNKFESNQSDVHDGDIVNKLVLPIEHSGNTKLAPSLGKGTFDILVICGNVECVIDKIKVYVPSEPSSTTLVPDTQPKTASEDLNKNEDIRESVLNSKCQFLKNSLGGLDPSILAYQLEKAGCQ